MGGAMLLISRPRPNTTPRQGAVSADCSESKISFFNWTMRLWVSAMEDRKYNIAAKIYDNNALVTGPHGTFQGKKSIKVFLAKLGNLTTLYEYIYIGCNAATGTFTGKFDFFGGGEYDVDITFEAGKITKEVLTSRNS